MRYKYRRLSHLSSGQKKKHEIMRYLTLWAKNLIGNWEPSREYFHFLCSVIPDGAQRELYDRFFGNVEDSEYKIELKKTYPFKRKFDTEEQISMLGDDLCDLTDANLDTLEKVENFILEKLELEIAALENEKNSLTEKIREVAGYLGLNEIESKILLYLHCSSQAVFLERLSNDYISPLNQRIRSAAPLLDIPASKLFKALNKNEKLVNLGLVEFSHNSFELNSNVDEYLHGLGEMDFADTLLRLDKKEVFDLETFQISKSDLRNLTNLLASSGSATILFYGRAGTGKSELARALFRSLNIPAYFVEHGDLGRGEERKVALAVAANLAKHELRGVIFDEADEFLSGSKNFFDAKASVGKGWLNDFLDRSSLKVIFIANDIFYLEESVRRRFDYSIRFDVFSEKDRLQHWNVALKDSQLSEYLDNEFVQNMTKVFEVNAGGISRSLLASEKILGIEMNVDAEKVKTVVQDCLEKHLELTQGKKPNFGNFNHSLYDPTILNIDANLHDVVCSLENANAILCSNERNKTPMNLNLLFHGIPGSGKTEFAKYLAQKLGIDVIVKRASDLLDMFIGESEKKIRSAFQKAEKSNSILLVDECDSFLASRENAVRSWEISQTNEFLTCMENFRGIFIASTNFLDHLDSAVMRRFHWKIKFSELKPEDKLKLFAKYFKKENLTEENRQRLSKIHPLTAGDFKAVFHRLQFSDISAMSIETLLNELVTESRYKKSGWKNKVGFYVNG